MVERFTIDDANLKLKFGIKLLHENENMKQPFKGAIYDVWRIKKQFEADGLWWQVKIIDIWMKKAQKKGDFL